MTVRHLLSVAAVSLSSTSSLSLNPRPNAIRFRASARSAAVLSRLALSTNAIDMGRYPISDPALVEECRAGMDAGGIVYLPHFLEESARVRLVADALVGRNISFRSSIAHNAYLADNDLFLPRDHPRNRLQRSSKGLVAYDQLPEDSELKMLYHSPEMKAFIRSILSLDALHVSDDPMNAVHLNYYSPDDALGWHFDNSEFFVNMLLQRSEGGGVFEYVSNSRTEDDPNFDGVDSILDGTSEPMRVDAESGSLIVFRGNKSIHRVSPVTEGERISAILTYESKPGVRMNEYTRRKFFGRTIGEP